MMRPARDRLGGTGAHNGADGWGLYVVVAGDDRGPADDLRGLPVVRGPLHPATASEGSVGCWPVSQLRKRHEGLPGSLPRVRDRGYDAGVKRSFFTLSGPGRLAAAARDGVRAVGAELRRVNAVGVAYTSLGLYNLILESGDGRLLLSVADRSRREATRSADVAAVRGPGPTVCPRPAARCGGLRWRAVGLRCGTVVTYTDLFLPHWAAHSLLAVTPAAAATRLARSRRRRRPRTLPRLRLRPGEPPPRCPECGGRSFSA